jgi:hypothetical protein
VAQCQVESFRSFVGQLLIVGAGQHAESVLFVPAHGIDVVDNDHVSCLSVL